MLAHPTLDKLNDMGLTGMAKAFNELLTTAKASSSPMRNGSGFCWSENGVRVTIASLPPVCGSPSFVIRLCQKMSITAASVAWTGRCS